MEAVLQWGLNLIIAIQQIHGPALDAIFRAITFAGEEQFYLVLLPLILWCFDYGFGAVMAVFFMISTSVNVMAKDLFQQPRPFELNPSVKLSDATGYGLPSGHAQISLTVWGSLADRLNKKWFWIVAAVVVLLISFSRIFLGVHFPTDVFAGLIIGGILLVLYIVYHAQVEKWLAGLNIGFQLLLAIAVPALFLLPYPATDALTGSGAFLGIGIGLIFKTRYLSYSTAGPWWQRTVRFIVGIVVLFALYLGLKATFPPDASASGPVFRVVRYALIGGWIIIGAPWFFRVTRLAKASA
jgi:membrane-associated phospholipid phosphatase